MKLLSFIPLVFVGWAAATCENTPSSRNCWGSHSIEDDPHVSWPTTGDTAEFTFRITNMTLAPDGHERLVLGVNGQYPGPPIEANWGDNIVVHVINELQENGTSIHFHGVRQLNSNYADGAVSLTQCPIAPGESYMYRWKATQHGTSWYHSHFNLQYSDGVVGPIIIHGPKTENYDYDLGSVLLTDWYHETATKLSQTAATQQLGLPPVSPNGLINGKNINTLGDDGVGERWTTTFRAGKKHLLRLVNTGTEVTFKFSIDGHKLRVVAMDWVPIKPYTTNTLFISIGQRYDVIVEANQTPKDYWVRASPQLTCLALNTQVFNIRGIVRYDASSTETPKTLSGTIADACIDEKLTDLIPYHEHAVGAPVQTVELNPLTLADPEDSYALRWYSDKSDHPYGPAFNNPAIQQIIKGPTTPLTTDLVPIELPGAKKWVYFIIQSQVPLTHPMHLHGHDVYTLARGVGLYLPGTTKLNLENPTRRDTVLLPASGFLVLAFETDNPGIWLLHCHIAWHLHHGLAMTVVERREDIQTVYSREMGEVNEVCADWKASGLPNE